jgi:hypothetical protein
VDGGAVSHTEVIVDTLPMLWDEPVGVHAEVWTCVGYKTLFTDPVCDEEEANGCMRPVQKVSDFIFSRKNQ